MFPVSMESVEPNLETEKKQFTADKLKVCIYVVPNVLHYTFKQLVGYCLNVICSLTLLLVLRMRVYEAQPKHISFSD